MPMFRNIKQPAVIRHAAFAATQLNKIFSSRQPRQGVEVLQHFRDGVSPCTDGEISGLDVAVCAR